MSVDISVLIVSVILSSLNLSTAQFYIYQDVELKWSDHDALCAFNYGTSLASIHNSVQDNDTRSLCNVNNCFIGLNDLETESILVWSDGTNFDYGNDTSGGVAPWTGGNPDNFENQDCVRLSQHSNGGKWDDADCEYTYKGICNYPNAVNIINDLATQSKRHMFIGWMDILDEIYIEFNFIIHNMIQYNNVSILHIGNNKAQNFPTITMNTTDNSMGIIFSSVSDNKQYFKSNMLNLNTLYHFEFYVTQENIYIKINDTFIYSGSISSHSVIIDRTMYLSNPWNSPANITLTGLKITTSNSYKPNTFNYLCDYNNRFTQNNIGTFNYDAVTCQLTQTDSGAYGAVVWLGENDLYSTNWTNFKIESEMVINTGTSAGILLRTQSISDVNNGGEQYEFSISIGDQQVRMAYIDGKWNQRWLYDAVFTYETKYKLRVEVKGNKFDVYLDNKWIFTQNDTTYSFGSVGLRSYASYAIFHTLRITFDTNGLESIAPTNVPSIAPSIFPTLHPTNAPSIAPTQTPINDPTMSPSHSPIVKPTRSPQTNGCVDCILSTISVSQTELVTGRSSVSNSGLDLEYVIAIIAVGTALVCIMFIVIYLFIRKKKDKANVSQTEIEKTMQMAVIVATNNVEKITNVSEIQNKGEKDKSEDSSDEMYQNTKGSDYGVTKGVKKETQKVHTNDHSSISSDSEDDKLFGTVETTDTTSGNMNEKPKSQLHSKNTSGALV
eukprot:104746_1